MSLQRLVINSDFSAVGFKSVCDLAPGQLPALNNFIDYLGGLSGGNYMALLAFKVGAVQAAGTVTFTSTGPTNGQTCTIAGVTFTAVTSGATGDQFNINASPTVVATNLKNAINGHTGFSGVLTATSALGVVTITSDVPGLMGNFLSPLANVNLSNASFSSWASGSDGTAYNLDLR